jgi:hypothetical protein
MIDKVLDRVLESPLEFAIAFLLVVIALAIFARLIGSPIRVILERSSSLASNAINELRGNTGPVGIIDLLIVLFTFLLGVLVLIKPSLIGLFKDEGYQSKIAAVIVFLAAGAIFIYSLRMTAESDKIHRLLTRKKLPGDRAG